MDSAPVANVPRSIYTPCVVGYFSTKVEMTHRYCGLLKLVVENKPIGHKPPLVLFLRGFPFEVLKRSHAHRITGCDDNHRLEAYQSDISRRHR